MTLSSYILVRKHSTSTIIKYLISSYLKSFLKDLIRKGIIYIRFSNIIFAKLMKL